MKLLIIFILVASCKPTAIAGYRFAENDSYFNVEAIESFARLYGYVRWFHPSDEALEINWDKFAVLGVQKVKNIKSTIELKDTLLSLFTPIVPGIQINETGEFEKNTLATDGKIVAWQYLGVDLGYRDRGFRSLRTNIFRLPHSSNFINPIPDFSVDKRYNDVTELFGKNLKFSGHFKINKEANHEHKAFLYIYSIFRHNPAFPFVSHKKEITSTEWKKYELLMPVHEQDGGTIAIAYGLMLNGDVEVWADDFQLLVDNNGIWETVDNQNMGFESGAISQFNGDWFYQSGHYNIEVTDNDSFSGKYCLKATYTGVLFDNLPRDGESIQEAIGNGLYCHVPLTLYTTDGKSTYPKTNVNEFKRLQLELERLHLEDFEDTEDMVFRNIGNIVVIWNVFQHFFPYMHVVNVDWEQELVNSLKQTIEAANQNEFNIVLEKMLAKLQDNTLSIVNMMNRYYLPIVFEYIEGEIVVAFSEDSLLHRGDIVKKIDDKNALEVLTELEQKISASEQSRRLMATRRLGSKFENSQTIVEVQRSNQTYQVAVNMTANPPNMRRSSHLGIIEVDPGIFYVNSLNNIDLDTVFDTLAEAKAVIYDLRFLETQSLYRIIQHLTQKPLSFQQMRVPQIIYPNRKHWTFHSYVPQQIIPREPTFQSKSIVITNTITAAKELLVGLLDYYNLATTVGVVTAGNGRLSNIFVTYGQRVEFSGIEVLKHDGSQLYIKGYEPHFPVQNTMQAFIEGRDLYLEKALEIARNEDNLID